MMRIFLLMKMLVNTKKLVKQKTLLNKKIKNLQVDNPLKMIKTKKKFKIKNLNNL